MISGWSSRPFTNGYSIGSPKRRANARNCAGVRSWSRKKITRCSSHACRIAATVSSSTLREIDAADLGAERAGDRGT